MGPAKASNDIRATAQEAAENSTYSALKAGRECAKAAASWGWASPWPTLASRAQRERSGESVTAPTPVLGELGWAQGL
eukprot:8022691-Alexandrium_andersonii.AAC.1